MQSYIIIHILATLFIKKLPETSRRRPFLPDTGRLIQLYQFIRQ